MAIPAAVAVAAKAGAALKKAGDVGKIGKAVSTASKAASTAKNVANTTNTVKNVANGITGAKNQESDISRVHQDDIENVSTQRVGGIPNRPADALKSGADAMNQSSNDAVKSRENSDEPTSRNHQKDFNKNDNNNIDGDSTRQPDSLAEQESQKEVNQNNGIESFPEREKEDDFASQNGDDDIRSTEESVDEALFPSSVVESPNGENMPVYSSKSPDGKNYIDQFSSTNNISSPKTGQKTSDLVSQLKSKAANKAGKEQLKKKMPNTVKNLKVPKPGEGGIKMPDFSKIPGSGKIDALKNHAQGALKGDLRNAAKNAKPALQNAAKNAKPALQNAAKNAKPALQNAAKSAKPALQNAAKSAKPALKNAAKAAKPALKKAAPAAKKAAAPVVKALIPALITALKIGFILAVIVAIVSLLSSCVGAVFGGAASSSDDDGVIEQERLFIPKVKVNDPKTICSDDQKSTGNGTFTHYDLKENELRALAAICQRENGTPRGAAATASQMANLLELKRFGDKYSQDAAGLLDLVRNSRHYGTEATHRTPSMMDAYLAGNTYPINGAPDIDPKVQEAVKKVLIEGMRTLPKYVDNYDTFSLDIIAIKDGKGPKEDRNSFVPHVTGMTTPYKDPGVYYTFYCFPDDDDSDAFGYNIAEERETYGDDCYAFNDLGIDDGGVGPGIGCKDYGSSSSSSSSSSSTTSSSSSSTSTSSGSRFKDREDCIEDTKDTSKNVPLGEWVYFDQVNPNWDLEQYAIEQDKNTMIDTRKGRVPLYQTFGSSCGQVAIAMILASYSGDSSYTPTWMRSESSMRYGNQGINQTGFADYINANTDKFHLKASTGNWDLESDSWDKIKTICDGGGCALLYETSYSSGGAHWVVVRKVDGDNVTVANPNGGKEDVFSKQKLIDGKCPNNTNQGHSASCVVYLEKS